MRRLTTFALLCSLHLCAQAQTPPPQARFHHVHLNSTDPAAAIEFYTQKFAARKERYAGVMDGVWTGDSWLFFRKVDTPPPSEIVSSIWHIGWGAEDMPATYQKQVDSGTHFATPLTDISGMVGGTRPFFYAYVDGPDHALIELNTASHHHFGHVHLFSADPPAAGEWYAKNFGWRVRTQPEKRVYNNVPIGPAAFVTADHVSMILYPLDYARTTMPALWKDRETFAPTRGRVIDHIGFAVDDLDATLARLRANGVKVTAEPRSLADTKVRFAFIEGPDGLTLDLVEDPLPPPAQKP